MLSNTSNDSTTSIKTSEYKFSDGNVSIINTTDTGPLINILQHADTYITTHAGEHPTELVSLPVTTSIYHDTTDKLLDYMRYVHYTTKQMWQQTSIFELTTTNQFPEKTPFIQFSNKRDNAIPTEFGVGSNQNESEIVTINIICYGKNLTYLLKYISFIVGSKSTGRKYTNRPFNLICVCDKNSFNNYQHDAVNINQTLLRNQTSFAPPTPETRHHLIQFLEVPDALQTYSNPRFASLEDTDLNSTDMRNLRLCNIFFAKCDHILSYGVGGKRALICHMNHQWGVKYAATLDDNITGIYRKSCGEYNTAMKLNCNAVNVPDNVHIIERMTPSTLFNDLESQCGAVNIVELIYGELIPHLRTNLTHFMVGIDKGKGRAKPTKGKDGRPKENNKTENIAGTQSLYKLNVCVPEQLHAHWYFYNPFFTRFAEDIAFNCALAKNKQNYVFAQKYYLRFGHDIQSTLKHASESCSKPINTTIAIVQDYEDYLPTRSIISRSKIPEIQPVYIMYVLFSWYQLQAGNLTYKYKYFPCSSNVAEAEGQMVSLNLYTIPWMEPPKQSKYGKYSLFMYTIILQLIDIYYKNPPLFQVSEDSRTSLFMYYQYKMLTLEINEIVGDGIQIKYQWNNLTDVLIPELDALKQDNSGNISGPVEQVDTLYQEFFKPAKDTSICNNMSSLGNPTGVYTGLHGIIKKRSASSTSPETSTGPKTRKRQRIEPPLYTLPTAPFPTEFKSPQTIRPDPYKKRNRNKTVHLKSKINTPSHLPVQSPLPIRMTTPEVARKRATYNSTRTIRRNRGKYRTQSNRPSVMTVVSPPVLQYEGYWK
jgi:hypothetical protein